jgi:prepilin-type N-terminal cleavage/methylation domain-containing protein
MKCQFKIAGIERRTRGSDAFTLLEMLAAVVISAIIFTAVFAGISGTFSLLTASREDLRATQIIVSRMEALHLEAWGNSANQASQIFNTSLVPRTFTDYFYPMGLNSTTNEGTVYTGKVDIYTNLSLTPSSSYGNALAQIVITVSWTDSGYGSSILHSRSMSTYIAQNGIQNYVYTH